MDIDFSAPDRGLVEVLEQCPPPTELLGLDLGCYTGRQAMAMVPYCSRVIAYDIDLHYRDDALALMRKKAVSFEFQADNVLGLWHAPGTVGVMSIGMVIYNPKSAIQKFLRRAVDWLPPRGILHMQFALVGDGSEQSPFVQQGCVREEGYEHSYIFYGCGHCFQCFEYGQNGGSFWEEEEADQLIFSLDSGGFRIACREEQRFVSPSVDPHGEVDAEPLDRVFYNVTAIKN